MLEDEFKQAFPALLSYIDLSNEQVFLRMNGRIRRATWNDWREGIKSNLRRPAFAKAWSAVKDKTNSFSELRRLESTCFRKDPRGWLSLWRRILG